MSGEERWCAASCHECEADSVSGVQMARCTCAPLWTRCCCSSRSLKAAASRCARCGTELSQLLSAAWLQGGEAAQGLFRSAEDLLQVLRAAHCRLSDCPLSTNAAGSQAVAQRSNLLQSCSPHLASALEPDAACRLRCLCECKEAGGDLFFRLSQARVRFCRHGPSGSEHC